jgi:hypothetical protein
MAVKKTVAPVVPATKREQLLFEHGKLDYELQFWIAKATKLQAEMQAAEPGNEPKFYASWLANINVRIANIQRDLQRVIALLEM